MKVAIIQTPLVNQTGGERQVLELAHQLQKKGNEVTIFTPYYNKSSCYPELIKKIEIKSLNNAVVENAEKKISTNKLLKFLYIFRHYKNFFVMKKLGEMIDDSYDIINPHNMPTHWAAFFAAKRIKKPIVWMCNEPPFWYLEKNNLFKIIFNLPLFPFFDKYSVKLISKIIVLDKLNEARVKKIYSRNTGIVHSGINLENFQERMNNSKTKRKIDVKNKFVLLAISTLVDYKRPLLAIDAFIEFAKDHKDAYLIFVGKGALEEKILSKIRSHKLEKSFSLLSDLTEEELIEIYKLANIFMFPAIQTWGLVVIEAMASKVPVVVEEKSGVAEIIQHGTNGFRVNFEDTKSVVSYLNIIYENRIMGKKIGKNAYTFVKENFSWKIYSENMLAFFNEAKRICI